MAKKSIKKELYDRQRTIIDFLESIRTRTENYGLQDINYCHIGTLDNIISQLNIIDNSMSVEQDELAVEEKIYNILKRKFEKK